MFETDNLQLKQALQALEAKQIEKAESLALSVLSEQPHSVESLYLLGLSALQQQEDERALAYLKQALALPEPFADVYLMYALTLENMGQEDEALKTALKARTLEPHNPRMNLQLGQMLLRQGHSAQAAFYFNNLWDYPGFAPVEKWLAECAFAEKKWQSAAQYFSLHLQKKPGDQTAIEQYLLALELTGAGLKVMTYCQQHLSQQPHAEHHARMIRHLAYQGEGIAETLDNQLQLWQQLYTLEPLDKPPQYSDNLVLGYYFNDMAKLNACWPLFSALKRQGVPYYLYLDFNFDMSLPFCHRRVWGSGNLELAKIIRKDKVTVLIDTAGPVQGLRLGLWPLRPAVLQLGITPWSIPGLDGCMPPHIHPQWFPFSNKGVDASAERDSRPWSLGARLSLLAFSAPLFQTWAYLLDRLPKTRLVLQAPEFISQEVRHLITSRFLAQGLSPYRLLFLADNGTAESRRLFYTQVDLVLASFPYCPVSVVAEPLWMQCPVIALRQTGNHTPLHQGWEGADYLEQAGYGDWVADTPQTYIEMAVRLYDKMQSDAVTVNPPMGTDPDQVVFALCKDLQMRLNGRAS